MEFRSRVFKQAHQIRVTSGATMSQALSKAWAIYRLTKKMKAETVSFQFKKKDGTIRNAHGTLLGVEVKGVGTPCYKTVSYFDVDKQGWRGFTAANLITA